MTNHADEGLAPEFDIADRMRKALRSSGVRSQAMADYLGVTRNTVGNYINGRSRPDKRTLMLWAMRTGVPFEWLQTGVTPPVTAPYPRLSAVGHHAPSLGVTLVGRELVPAA